MAQFARPAMGVALALGECPVGECPAMAGAIERLRDFLGEREWAARALDTSAWGRVCARIARIEPPPGGRVVVVVLNARDGALGAALADALGACGGDGAELVLCDARYFVGAPKSWDLAWLVSGLVGSSQALLGRSCQLES